METLGNTGTRSLKPSPASNHFAVWPRDRWWSACQLPGAFALACRPRQTPSPSSVSQESWPLRAGFYRLQRPEVRRVPPAADNGRRCGETARRVGMLGGGLQGQDVRACARPASVSAASLTALVSPFMASDSLLCLETWAPGVWCLWPSGFLLCLISGIPRRLLFASELSITCGIKLLDEIPPAFSQSLYFPEQISIDTNAITERYPACRSV